MELTELKLKLLIQKVNIATKMAELDENSKEFIDLSYKYTFLLGILSGLDMLTVINGDMAKELLNLFENKDDGKEHFIEKIYKE